MPKQVHPLDLSEDMDEICKECRQRAARLEQRRLAKYERYHSDESYRTKLVQESRERYAKDKETTRARCYLSIWRKGGILKPNAELLKRYLAVEDRFARAAHHGGQYAAEPRGVSSQISFDRRGHRGRQRRRYGCSYGCCQR